MVSDSPPDPDAEGDIGLVPDQGSSPGTPHWVKVFWVVALIVALVVVIMLVTGGGHGPGRHT